MFDSTIGTLLDIPSKTKDGLKSRTDLVNLDIRHELHTKSHNKRSSPNPRSIIYKSTISKYITDNQNKYITNSKKKHHKYITYLHRTDQIHHKFSKANSSQLHGKKTNPLVASPLSPGRRPPPGCTAAAAAASPARSALFTDARVSVIWDREYCARRLEADGIAHVAWHLRGRRARG